MTVTITRESSEEFDANVTDNGGGAAILAGALAHDPEAERRLAGIATFWVEATTTTNDAVSAANALINLSDKGVTFPDGYVRNIKLRAWSRANGSSSCGYVEREFVVIGGTNPVLSSPAPAGFLFVNGQAGTPLGEVAITSPWPTVAIPVAGTAGAPFYGLPSVAITTTPTPDEVYVGVTGLSGDSLRWRVEVDVGPLKRLAVGASD